MPSKEMETIDSGGKSMTEEMKKLIDRASENYAISSLLDVYDTKGTFKDAISWYVANIWHDASEEPNGEDAIVIAYDSPAVRIKYLHVFTSYSEWGVIKRQYKVREWCYLEDLFSIRKEERQ